MKEIMRKPPPYNPSPFSDFATIEDLGYTGNPPTGDVYDMETRDFINSTLSQSVPPYVILDPDDGNNTMTYDGNACPSVPPARPIALEDFPNLYPPQCPTSVSLQLGMISFAYVRADIMPEIYMQRFENSNDRGISNVWPGPGMILQYSDNKFWDDGRVAASYPADAYTLLRGACGVGRGLPELQFLIDPEDLQAMTEETIANVTDGKPVPWCPHDPKSPEDIEAISPSKLDAYCPGWVSDLYQYNAFNEFATRQLLDMGLTERDAREFAMCALDDWRFDDIFIPAATQDKEIDPYTLDTPGVPAYWYYSSDKWNEILIKSWGGVSLKELAKETIMYVLEEDSLESTVQAFKYARWLSDATGIPVPIVEVKNDGFFRIPEFYPGTDIPHPNFSDPLEVCPSR